MFFQNIICYYSSGTFWWLSRKESTCNTEDAGDVIPIPGSGTFPGGERENQLQYSYRESPMDRGTWWAKVHGVAKSQTRLSD